MEAMQSCDQNAAAPSRKRSLGAPGIMSIVAALALLVTLFLPYVSATPEYREVLRDGLVSSQKVVDGGSMTAADIADMSLVEYVRLYWEIAQEEGGDEGMSSSIFLAAPAITFGVTACLTALFAVLRRPVPTIVFSALAIAAAFFKHWFIEMLGVADGDRYVWGIASYLTFVIPAVLIGVSIWLLVVKKRNERAGA